MYLKVRHPDGSIDRLPLRQGKSYRLGSHPEADVVLAGPDIKPVHLGIVSRDGRFFAVPSKASKQVQWNGQLVHSTPLAVGDEIQVGGYLIHVKRRKQPASPAKKSSPVDELDDLKPLDDIDLLQEDPVEGLLDELVDEEAAAQPDPLAVAAPPSTRRKAKKKKPKKEGRSSGAPTQPSRKPRTRPTRVRRWLQSPWAAATICGLLLVPAVVFLVLFARSLPDEFDRFDEALQAYRGANYADAAIQFDELLDEGLPPALADEALVLRDLARIRERMTVGADWTDLRQQVARSWESWGARRYMATAQHGLSDILPAMLEGLLADATAQRNLGDTENANRYLAQATATYRLAEQALSPGVRRGSGWTALVVQLTQQQREMERSDAIDQALATIRGTADPDEAYAAWQRCVSRFPQAASDGRMNDAMSGLANRLVGFVRAGPLELPSTWSEQHAPSPNASHVVWPQSEANDSDTVPRLLWDDVGGVLYAVDPGDGRVAWRVEVGAGGWAATRSSPCIVYSPVAEEIQGLDRRHGKPAWSFPCPRPAGPAQRTGSRVLLAVEDRVLALDPASGDLVRQWVLPQASGSAAGPLPGTSFLAVAGRHSFVYVLDTESERCVACLYVGHTEERAYQLPVTHDHYLILAAADAHGGTRVTVFDMQEEWKIVQTLTARGDPGGPLHVRGRRVAWPTTGGELVTIVPDDANPYVPYRRLDDTIVLTAADRVRLASYRNQFITVGDRIGQLQLVAGSWQWSELAGFPGVAFDVQRTDDGWMVGSRDRRSVYWTAWTDAGRRQWIERPPAWHAGACRVVDGSSLLLVEPSGTLTRCRLEMEQPETERWRSNDVPGATRWSWEWQQVGDRWIAWARGNSQIIEARGNANEWTVQRHALPVPIAGLCATSEGAAALTEAGVGLQMRWDDELRVSAVNMPVSDRPIGFYRSNADPEQLAVVMPSGVSWLQRDEANGGAWTEFARAAADETLHGSAVVEGARLWVALESPGLQAFDPAEPAPVISVRLPAAITWGPAAVGGGIAAGCADGSLWFHRNDGRLEWVRQPFTSPVIGAAYLETGWLLAAGAQGEVVALDEIGELVVPKGHMARRLAAGPFVSDGRIALLSESGALVFTRWSVAEWQPLEGRRVNEEGP